MQTEPKSVSLVLFLIVNLVHMDMPTTLKAVRHVNVFQNRLVQNILVNTVNMDISSILKDAKPANVCQNPIQHVQTVQSRLIVC